MPFILKSTLNLRIRAHGIYHILPPRGACRLAAKIVSVDIIFLLFCKRIPGIDIAIYGPLIYSDR